MTSPEGRRVAIIDATFAIVHLVDDTSVLPPEVAKRIATAAVDGALPALERDWRQQDAELAARTLTAIGEAIAIVEGARPQALAPPS